MRRISVQHRRQAVTRRHHLGGDAFGPEAVTTALVALHATDPASVYLSVLARSHRSSLDDVRDALYERRSLVRWMAMRRTLFVVPVVDVPMMQAAASRGVADAMRRRLVSRLARNGSEPPIDGDVGAWLEGVEQRVVQQLEERGSATGAQLSADVPDLRTVIKAGAPSERPQNATTSILTLIGTEGRMVRGAPSGPWTSRHHRWEPVDRWWPDGLPELPLEAAQRELARRWLARYGPATAEDLQWWTGWTKAAVNRALAALPVVDVDLHGRAGIDLDGPDDDGAAETGPVATLLPALDPTPMGWKDRDWFLGVDPPLLFDRAGNIGPTLWWDGEVIGSWTVATGGEVRIRVAADRGAEAQAAAEAAAERLGERLDGRAVVPAFRTPLEAALRGGA